MSTVPPADPLLPTPDTYNAQMVVAPLDPDSTAAPVQCPVCAAPMGLDRADIVASPASDPRPRWRVVCPNGDDPLSIVAS